MESKNMNYVFNVEYFENINLLKGGSSGKNACELKKRNEELKNFHFTPFSKFQEWEKIPGFCSFSLYTSYPGLLVGTGNPHSIAVENAIKCGFQFDYVTGLPCVTGSSLKGTLRSMFPEDTPSDRGLNQGKTELIGEMLYSLTGRSFSPEEIKAVRNNIFEHNDCFIGVMPDIAEGDQILDLDYITPHKGQFSNPVPINIIKIRPNVALRFCFALSDYKQDDGEAVLTADQKLKLFKEIILVSGIGAKTNVGYGNLRGEKRQYPTNASQRTNTFSEGSRNNNYSQSKQFHSSQKAVTFGKCEICGKTTMEIPDKPGRYYRYCKKCNWARKNNQRKS